MLIANPETEMHAIVRLGRVGFDRAAGYLEPPVGPVLPTEQSERIHATHLAQELASENPPSVVDVPRPEGWKVSRIEASLNIPLASFPDRTDEIPTNRRVVLCYATGHRSAIAASVLERRSRGRTADLADGIASWSSALARD